jgi:nucleoside-diphosphate-sugar epimerase
LFSWISAHANVYVMGRGNNSLQFVHARDLIDAYMLAAAQSKTDIYNVGTDRYGTIRQALENLIQHANSRSKVRGLPRRLTMQMLRLLDVMGLSPLAPYHYLTYHRSLCFDIRKVLELGWKPRYSNDEMLRESYDSFLAEADSPNPASAVSPHRKRVNESALWLLRKLS